MAQIFHRSLNTVSKLTIGGLVVFVGAAIGIALELDRSPVTTGQRIAVEQPIPFSHEHHVRGLGIDCRYCHTSVEDSSFAGIPPTKTCMNCHSQIWVGSEMLKPVRESYRTNTPLQWERVHRLADFAYFDHSIHVNKGVGCSTCHGQVNEMPLIWQENSLRMEWCLDCHRQPEKNLRPKDQIFNMDWQPPANQAEVGAKLAAEYGVQSYMSCSTCHH